MKMGELCGVSPRHLHASTFCPLDIGRTIGYNICVEIGPLPLPAGPVEVSARRHKVFIMLLPPRNSVHPLKCDIMSICRNESPTKGNRQPSDLKMWPYLDSRFPILNKNQKEGAKPECI
jgi:hypothetical protein